MQPTAANNLTRSAIEWLWPGYLARGTLAILDGDPGIGKSLITLDLAARLTTGQPWPNDAAGPSPAPALLLCDEDTDATVVNRLETLGADLSRAFLWPRQDGAELPRLPADIARLDQAVADTGAKLLVIDPIMAFLDRSVEVNSDARVRHALRPLAKLAEKHHCAVLLVRHLNKKVGPQALYRGGGSIAFVAACRLAWLAARDPKREDRYVLAQPKNNFAARQPSLAYTLPTDAARVAWAGSTAWLADDLTARRRERPARQRACEFLKTFLAAGPRTTQEIWDAALIEDLSENTLRRAKDELKITWRRVQTGTSRADYWLLKGQKAPGDIETPELDAWFENLANAYPPLTPLDDDYDARGVCAADDAGEFLTRRSRRDSEDP